MARSPEQVNLRSQVELCLIARLSLSESRHITPV